MRKRQKSSDVSLKQDKFYHRCFTQDFIAFRCIIVHNIGSGLSKSKGF